MVEIPTKHGGPRERRHSRHIQRKPASNLHHAVKVAARIGRPLNQFVTLSYAHTTCAPEEVSERFERLRQNHFGPWLRRPPRGVKEPCGPAAYVWVIEATNGIAVHWLVHVPATRLTDFKKRLPRWLKATAGEPTCDASAVHMRPAYNPMGAKLYMLKGMDETVAKSWGIRPVPQGIIHGKRSGFSRSLGPTARRKIGYRPRRFVPSGTAQAAPAP